ncbi:MAG: diguanylate cyclase, partial [Cyanobium sp.]
DDPAHRRLMEITLSDEGIEVLSLRSGEECLAQAADFDPDVILIDIQMPGLDGLETCRRLKLIPELAVVPVVFITGSGDNDRSAVEALEAGANDFISKDAPGPVLIARVRCQITIRRSLRRLRAVAMTDELTGLFTRRFLLEATRRLLKTSTRHGPGHSTACLFCDLDYFKNINDTLGHVAGDEVLRIAARALLNSTRETDVVGRYGGEEFVVVLPETDEKGARVTAEKIRATLERESPTTVSVGIAMHAPLCTDGMPPWHGIDEAVTQLLEQADTAMYASKAAGRNRVTVFHPGLFS